MVVRKSNTANPGRLDLDKPKTEAKSKMLSVNVNGFLPPADVPNRSRLSSSSSVSSESDLSAIAESDEFDDEDCGTTCENASHAEAPKTMKERTQLFVTLKLNVSIHRIFLSFCMTMALACFIRNRIHISNIRMMIAESSLALQEVEDLLFSSEHDVKSRERDLRSHRNRNEKLRIEREALEGSIEEIRKTEKIIAARLEQAEVLKKEIQRRSRVDAISKHGEPPHYVRFDLEFPIVENEPRQKSRGSFVVKMADIDQSPHSVHYFLEMVSRNLWDGSSFTTNAKHLIKALPIPYAASAEDKTASFKESGLSSPAFAENGNDEEPHRKYTMAFASDKEDLGFYINTEDNNDIHGPGKQNDPVFGEVVSGFDTIARIQAIPTLHDVLLQNRVGIRQVKVLPKRQ